MSKKKTKKTKSPYPENGKVRIRHSYYTFAREFPSKILPLESKRRKHKKSRTLKTVLLCFLLVGLTVLSFFTVNLFLDISYTDVDKLTSSAETTVPDAENAETEPPLPFYGESIRGLYMPAEKLGDREYIKSFIKQIKRKNCNSTVIDFKNSEGKLSYTSLNENAILARTAIFDNNTVRQALDLFENEGIKVIARVYCFMDNTASTANSDLAVKYMNTDVNWTDARAEDGGKSRLNPLSNGARSYLFSIIKEILQFKIDGILLEEVSFPSGEYVSNATYPGEKKVNYRNRTLKAFVEEVKRNLPEGCILLMGHGAEDIIETNRELYFGSMLSCAADGFAVDTLKRKDGIIADKETDFVSILSFFSSLKEKTGEKRTVYTVDISEYSAALIRKMQKSGYTDFIIYSHDGIYR